MKPRPRIRKFFKWGGVVVSVVLLAVWVGSVFLHVGYCPVSGPELFVHQGRLCFYFPRDHSDTDPCGLIFVDSLSRELEWWFACYQNNFELGTQIPLWPFVLTSVGITAAAWRMDTLAQRRKRFGGCPACGYDRTGLAANAPCPECNAKA